jgi:hypothetical protein
MLADMVRDMSEPEQHKRISGYDLFGYIAAAAILVPVGIWLKDSGIVGRFIFSLFGH